MPKSIPGVMKEFKHGELHSGSSTGPVVKNPKQAIAIAINEQPQAHPHRLAGSHDGGVVTEHHRLRKATGK